MDARESFYLGALLHDVGKFIVRAEWENPGGAARGYISGKKAPHEEYSAEFIQQFASIHSFLSEPFIASIARSHHSARKKVRSVRSSNRKKGSIGHGDQRYEVCNKLLQIADSWASKERKKDVGRSRSPHYKARLQSIFSGIILPEKTMEGYKPSERYHDLALLSINEDALFASEDQPEFSRHVYDPILPDFHTTFGRIGDADELLPLLRKYFNTVPAQTPWQYWSGCARDRPDINLFDHLRVTAAIALCLYDEWNEAGGVWHDRDRDIRLYRPNGNMQDVLPAPCILIGGDISGIQKFIFNVPSKRAAKTLKARSFYVQLLEEVFARKVLADLKLKPANLLYQGGGRFYILSPKVRESELETCRQEVMQVLANRSFIDEELYLSLAAVDVAPADFMHKFGEKWTEVNRLLEVEKLRKYRQQFREHVFEPKQQQISDSPKGDGYTGITRLLRDKHADGFVVKAVDAPGKASPPQATVWKKLFEQLGYKVDFSMQRESVQFNDTAFEGKRSGYRFAVKDLPFWRPETIKAFKQQLDAVGRSLEDYLDEDDDTGEKRDLKEGDIVTYSQLAFKAFYETGTEKLGILKMDVDDLGKIFAEGFADDIRTPSRLMSLSRSLQWFFEGYMNTILQDDQFRDYLYPIFSGGDDLFIVGAWHKVFELALKIQEEFRRFVCDNPSLTLSASLLVVDEHYPVSRFAVLAEERLHEAKYGSIQKNSINVFGETLSWEEFREAQKVRDALLEIVAYENSRAVIRKVLRGCTGLQVLHERAARQNSITVETENSLQVAALFANETVYGEKVWRMAYFLRDLEHTEAKECAGKILEMYENVVGQSMQKKPVNPMKIAVGARWAEFASRT